MWEAVALAFGLAMDATAVTSLAGYRIRTTPSAIG
jgi:hypothetical protein